MYCRTLILLTGFVCSLNAKNADSYSYLEHFPVLSAINSNAFEFQGGSSMRAATMNMCVVNCLEKLKSNDDDDYNVNDYYRKLSKPYRFKNQFDNDTLNVLCMCERKMNITVHCLQSCSDSQFRTTSLISTNVGKYICFETSKLETSNVTDKLKILFDSEFLQYSTCYNKVNNEMESFCHDESHCGPLKSEAEHGISKRFPNEADLETMLQKTCKYINCFNGCDNEKLIQECGSDANYVLKNFYRKIISTSQELYRAQNIQIEMPYECTRVGNSGVE